MNDRDLNIIKKRSCVPSTGQSKDRGDASMGR